MKRFKMSKRILAAMLCVAMMLISTTNVPSYADGVNSCTNHQFGNYYIHSGKTLKINPHTYLAPSLELITCYQVVQYAFMGYRCNLCQFVTGVEEIVFSMYHSEPDCYFDLD
jgi:hypothetical protein